jgi:hypothetical protein
MTNTSKARVCSGVENSSTGKAVKRVAHAAVRLLPKAHAGPTFTLVKVRAQRILRMIRLARDESYLLL